jgi:hypothetical protein
MGERSLRTAVAHLRGEPYEKSAATAVVLVTRENMDEPSIRPLLRPDLSVLKE